MFQAEIFSAVFPKQQYIGLCVPNNNVLGSVSQTVTGHCVPSGNILGKSAPVHDGWAPESVWTLWVREKSYFGGNRTRAVQSVARRCTKLSRLRN
jgi:hypothetical protein